MAGTEICRPIFCEVAVDSLFPETDSLQFDRVSLEHKTIAGVAQLVEHHVANVIVEGSSPFTRSFLLPPELPRFGGGSAKLTVLG